MSKKSSKSPLLKQAPASPEEQPKQPIQPEIRLTPNNWDEAFGLISEVCAKHQGALSDHVLIQNCLKFITDTYSSLTVPKPLPPAQPEQPPV